MKKNLIILFLIINLSQLFAQVPYLIEGTVVNNTIPGTWTGVNIPRNQPTAFTYQNNSVTSINASGYMLQAGDEGIGGTNNNLQGEIITGNQFIWNGTDRKSITHGIFTGYNLNAVIKYNYLDKVPMGLVRKSNGMTNTSGGVAYNIVINPIVGFVAKGMNNVNVYNNTFYSTKTSADTWRGLVDIYSNTDGDFNSPSKRIKVFNNIFYTKYQISNIYIYDAACLPGFESDYNVFYCEAGTPTFNYLGSLKTFIQWQALGYDKHSVIINPDFIDFTDFVPSERLDYGTDLGSPWQKGLSVDAVWGTTDPETADQNGTWQVGARIYSSQMVPVTGITVSGARGANTINTDNGSLQLITGVLPVNATDKTVTWSIVNGTGQAIINSTGLVTAVNNGTVTARATANDGSGMSGTLMISISNQIVPVSGITVSGAGGATIISTDNGSLQLSATVSPASATDKTVTWSLANGTGQGTINASGLVTAADNGTVTARATATDGSGVYGILIINISNQITPVTGIIVSGAGGATTITSDNGSLQASASVSPPNATDKTVTWSIVNGTGLATINSAGLVRAVENGTVAAKATANDGSSISGTLIITISNQITSVTGITITGVGGTTTITSDNGTLQLSANVLPANATDKTLIWSIINGTGFATINSTGLVTAVDNGSITAKATANDGSGISGTVVITISNQVIPVTNITVNRAGGTASINTDNGSLQLSTVVLPANATNKTVTWSIVNETGEAIISTTGLVTAIDNGTVTARATAIDGSGVSGTLIITISNQVIPVTLISVSGTGGITAITADNGSLQLNVSVLPANASNKNVTWSMVNGTGQATISTTGLVTAVDNGTVTARATSLDGSGIYGTLVITISNQIIPVTVISVAGAGGARIITAENGSLQLSASVLPANATDKSVTWSVVNGTGQAIINDAGLFTAERNGIVSVIATANDGSGVSGTLIITISTTIIPVKSITVTGVGGETTIANDNGSLQLIDAVFPANSTDNTVTWSIVNGTGEANIITTGLVTAISNGTVIARATANDGTGVSGTLVITISNQLVPVTGITVTGAGGSAIISADNGTLQLIEALLPSEATSKTVTWSIVNITGQATINTTGLVTAIDNGTVSAIATANDGSGISGSLLITISNQIVPVAGINVTGAGDVTEITADNGTLQLNAEVLPANATDKNVTWSIVNGTGEATISTTGLVTAVENGTVTVRATSDDGSDVSGTLLIIISNQIVHVSGIIVSGAGGGAVITTDNGTLQLNAVVLPENATNKSITWLIVNGTGQATINSTGLVTAVDNGTVMAGAIADDGSGVYGTIVVIMSNQIVPITDITITGAGDVTNITTDNGSLQLSATVLPSNATDKTVIWSVVNGTGQATINLTGHVTAIENGTVTAIATAIDGSGVSGTIVITISNQTTPVTRITVSGDGDANSITTDNGSLQLSAAVSPSNATDKSVIWSIVNGSGQAAINATGFVTAVDNGTVTAIATANDGSGVSGTILISISNQIVPVSGITVSGAGGATIISTDNGSLQLTATVIPAGASDKTVTWSIVNGTGQATINSTGLVTAIYNGTVTARAVANDGSGIYGIMVITIFNQITPVTGITLSGEGGSTTITYDNGSLQLSATVLPSNATNKTVNWSIINGIGMASINSTGLITAFDNGSITVRATANDGSGVYGTLVIMISNQSGPVSSIIVTGADGVTTITTENGSLQLSAAVSPANATVKTVTWSFVNSTGLATINASGFVTAIDNGTVTVRAMANDGSGVFDILVITISNQIVPVNGITVIGEDGATTINTDDGSLQLSASIMPSNATDKRVKWSIINDTGEATINSTGLVTAIDNGTVTARATANDASGAYGTMVITIFNQIISVTEITVIGTGDTTIITEEYGSLQLSALVSPSNATDKTVIWSIVNGTGRATINSDGLVTAIDNGTVTAKATANDGSGVYGSMNIPIAIDKTDLLSMIVTSNEIRIKLNDNYISWKAGLYNLQGGLVLSKLVDSDIFVFDISSIPSGIYIVVLSKGDNLKAAKVIKP